MSEVTATDIAIVGMSLRFPGASTASEFWSNLKEGRESIFELSDEDLSTAGVAEEILADPNYVKRAPLLRGVEWFDAAFFGLNPNEASVMDPQHRLFLECGWHALEDAGYNPETFDAPIGVFGGSGYNAYMTYHLARNRELLDSMGFFLLRHTGNDKDFLTTRLSYCLNLTGPSVNVQTACSTSLVGIHLGIQSLLNFECDIALAGGVTIELPLNHGYRYSPGEIYSPDGHCRAFDADSQGTVFGSGCGIVVLRRLEDAINDKDQIRAIIKGSAINNDGSGKAGYLAPSVEGQAQAIIEAIEFAGVDPESVSYIETHGTGTSVGDPIEVSALTAAYGAKTSKKQYCGIGSVKTNIGHLDTAAGVASVIKTVLAMENKQLPPSLHYKKPNPEIDFSATPFYVNAELNEWQPAGSYPRRAGVSSLGVGGTNAHIILEEAPVTAESGRSRESQLLLLSAKNDTSLQAASDNLVEFISNNKPSLADLTYTYKIGRQGFVKRKAIIFRTERELIERLDADQHQLVIVGDSNQIPPPVSFMFTGQGAQYIGMAKQLYATEPYFQEEFNHCAKILSEIGALDINALLFENDPNDTQAAQLINQTENTQPALFVVEYCLARLWMHWGIEPSAMIGHSIGEYVAACLSGVFSLENSLKLVSLRGKLMQSTLPGSMLSIPISSQEAKKYLSDDVELAANNATSLCVLSGKNEKIIEIQKQLEEEGIPASLLKTSHAFHSRSMEPILEEFKRAVAEAQPNPPQRPFISNLTGKWITAEEAIDPGYWGQHLRRPVLFAAGISRLLEDTDRVFLEIGPATVLTQLVKQHEKILPSNKVIESLGGPKSEFLDSENILAALAKLWTSGIAPNWESYYEGEKRFRISAPGYAFHRQRYWIDADGIDSDSPSTEEESVAQGGEVQLNKIVWKPVDSTALHDLPDRVVLIGNDNKFLESLRNEFEKLNIAVLQATFAEQFLKKDEYNFDIRLSASEDYEALMEHVNLIGASWIIHTGSIGLTIENDFSAHVIHTFDSALYTIQAAVNSDECSLVFLSDQAYSVVGNENQNCLQALNAGPALVAKLELPQLNVCAVDIFKNSPGEIISSLQQAIALTDHHPSVYAIRSGQLYCKSFDAAEPQKLDQADVNKNGCYIITGGLSGLGYEITKDLAEQGCNNIAILGKTVLPSTESWEKWFSEHNIDDPITTRMQRIRALQNKGVNLRYYATDISDRQEIKTAIDAISEDFEQISGVVHCAGTLDDGPLLTKDVNSAHKVLAPKVAGALNLAQSLRDKRLDVFILFSSVSSIWGSAGQIDYVSANAFLDAAVPQLEKMTGARVIALNWAAWRDTGMTARLANPLESANTQISHPLLDSCLYDFGGTSIYSTSMYADKHWIIDEHRAAGTLQPILPGTGFLEMVKAAFSPLANESHVQLTDVMFLSPFVLWNDEPREIRIQLEPWSLGTTFNVISNADPEDDESWFIHMKGRICKGDNNQLKIDLEAISARCAEKEEHPNEQLKFLNFGPRWQTIESLQMGDGEALLEVELKDPYKDDVASIWSHPGMMDVATAGVLKLIDGYDSQVHFYVPIAYSRLEFYGAMPDKWISHLVYRAADSQPGDIAVFDVTICDESGNVLALFEEFMLKCIAGPHSLVEARPPLSARTNPLNTNICLSPNLILQERLDESGLSVRAGIEAFTKILNSNASGQFAISNGALMTALNSIISDAGINQSDISKVPNFIDVTEVENSLNSHEAVVASAVLAQEDRFGELEIAAFIQLDPMLTTTVSELRRFIRKLVDEQLVPSKFIETEKLPTTAEGEIDKAKLPDPFGADDDFVAPSTETEKLLTRVWQNILGVDRISITDNFFDLGGHSLLGVRLLAAVRKETGIRLEDVVVVTYTLEQISAELDKRSAESG